MEQRRELTIEVYRKGDQFYAKLTADTPAGPFTRGGMNFPLGDHPFAAAEAVMKAVRDLAAHKGGGARNAGRHPNGYRSARYLTGKIRVLRGETAASTRS